MRKRKASHHQEKSTGALEGVIMLLSQNRGWYKHSLLTVHHSFESRPQGDLHFAVSHTTRSIHRLRYLHVLRSRIKLNLIFGLNVWKTGFKFLLPGRILMESIPVRHLALSIEFNSPAISCTASRTLRLVFRQPPHPDGKWKAAPFRTDVTVNRSAWWIGT